jgi:hypothetical protein
MTLHHLSHGHINIDRFLRHPRRIITAAMIFHLSTSGETSRQAEN